MTKPPEPETKWHWPQTLADRVNDGFLSVVRSTGKTMGGLSSGTMKGISKVGQVLIGSEQTMLEQQTKPSDAAPPRQLDEETEPAAPQDPDPLLDLAALLQGRSPRDAGQAVVLRKALDDLLLGSEEAGMRALKPLVGLGQAAEPLLLACLPTDSPRVAKLALEGLSRIGSQRLIDCISDVLESSDPELRLVAIRAAVGLRYARQQQSFLERGLRDPDAKVRLLSISYLSWHDSYWAMAEAMRLCNDKSPDVQWAAVETLTALRQSEANSILQLVKPSLQPANQRRAAILLGQRKDQGALSEKKEKRIRSACRKG